MGVQVWTQVFDHVVVAALAFQVVMLGLLFLQVMFSKPCIVARICCLVL